MEMRKVAAAAGADGRDLLTASHIFSGMHEDCIDVAVIGLHIFALAVFEVGMQHDNHIAPARAPIAREQHSPVSDRIDWITKVTVFSADPV